MNRLRARAAAMTSEAGFALMEVIVSAAVFALMAMAVLAGLDAASNSTGRERARSIAANLAEQDQERMRSMQVDSLADFTQTRTVDIDGGEYTVKSVGKWVRDETGGTLSCQNNSKQADYLQISSQVTSKDGRQTPVAIQSLVAPSVAYSSTRGSLAVQVNNRDGIGVAGIVVNISGPSSDNATTNEQGCAIFQYIPVGNYNILLNKPGWVNHFGVTAATGNQDVTAGTLNVRAMDYDVAAVADATIGTYVPGATDTSLANLIPSRALHISATNGGEPGMQRLWSFGSLVGTAELTNLFPFSTPYGVFTGKCEEANPIVYPGNGDYFPNYTGSVQTERGERDPVTVRQPPLNIRIRDTSGNFINSTQSPSTARRVRIFATLRTNTAECVEPTYLLHAMNNPAKTVAADQPGWPSHTLLGTNGLPQAWDPGLPFGVYDLCFDYQTSAGSSNWRRFTVSGYDNTAPLGQSSTLLVPTQTGTTGGSTRWSSSGTTVGTNKCAA